MKTYEVNFDGIVGPTHNYAGLSRGNIASMEHKDLTSYPKKAALQGLEKMHLLEKMGVKQALFPPHERPDIVLLSRLGFIGSEQEILKEVFSHSPILLASASSASSMWAANAATTSPAIDATDHLVHITPANLESNLHRAIETSFTLRLCNFLFAEPSYFCVHMPLPKAHLFCDEGAANHIRFSPSHGEKGLHLFVYGCKQHAPLPEKYPARQYYEASHAVSELLKLPKEQVIFAQQNPSAIDQGVFHNDVISSGNENVFLFHEEAFLETEKVLEELQKKWKALHSKPLLLHCINSDELSIQEAVDTYFFNSQIVTVSPQTMHLIAPKEAANHPKTEKLIEKLIQDSNNPIRNVTYLNLRESMQNGGGPACLRLRMILTQEEIEAIQGNVFLTEPLYHELKEWVNTYYREELRPNDLRDVSLLHESRQALAVLTDIMQLGPIYDFQQ